VKVITSINKIKDLKYNRVKQLRILKKYFENANLERLNADTLLFAIHLVYFCNKKQKYKKLFTFIIIEMRPAYCLSCSVPTMFVISFLLKSLWFTGC